MKKWIVFLILVIITCRCTRDFSTIPGEENLSRPLSTLEKSLTHSDNLFGLHLFQEIVKTSSDTNIFISPLSVALALGMTYNGASGKTRDDMASTLGFENYTSEEINTTFQSLVALLMEIDPKVVMEIANSIWYRNTFHVEQDFIDTNKTYYHAEVRPLDFTLPSSVEVINNWVDEKTHGKITEIINSIDPLTMMFLINAIYFKGTWTYEFDKEVTTEDIFNKPDGIQVPCQMMVQQNEFQYFETDSFQSVDIPYGDQQFSMTIFLPRSNVELDQFISEWDLDQWDQWLSSFSKQQGTVYLPKFKLEYKIKLNDVLSAMGMAIAFNPYQADFSLINPDEPPFIDKVLHKTFVEVNEEGTEAAAVTLVEMKLRSTGGSTGFFMRIDRPFVFLIRERTSNTILFIGKVVEPIGI